jgi:asparagine synthase (glutamine-hydrolysing)
MDAVLRDAVRGQMLSSDVPLGALLSGGIDSSLIVALMQAQSSRPVRTFSIGFAGSSSDEAPYARAVAGHLGTEHTELYVTAQDTLDTVPRLPEVYCEPFADSSQVPTLLVSTLARRHVTVALSGDGGDELFAGYERYQRVAQGFGRIAAVPRALRAVAGGLLQHTPLAVLDRLAQLAGNPGGAALPADRLRKIGALLGSADVAGFHRGLVSLWEPKTLMPRVAESPSIYSGALPQAGTLVEQLMLADTLCYLPDDLLVKVDRAAMAASLEVRAPFLDHRVVELAWRLDMRFKVRGGQPKWLPRTLLARYLPRHLFERPKLGFGLPVDGWLQGPLREWAETLLSTVALERDGLFDAATVRRRWDEHLTGRRNWQQALWCVLMFQAWAEHTRR